MTPIYIAINGKMKNVWDITPEDLSFEQMATTLAKLPRWGAQNPGLLTYPVSAHSIKLSRVVPKELALEALLHDGSEYIIGDIMAPYKNELPSMKEIDDFLLLQIFKRFYPKFDKEKVELNHIVVKYDKFIAMGEYYKLYGRQAPWYNNGTYSRENIGIMVDGIPDDADLNKTVAEHRADFINRYMELI